MMKHSIGVLLTMLTVAACGTGVESDPQAAGSDGIGGAHDPSNACPEADGPRHAYTTKEELAQLVLGRWVHCTGNTPFALMGSSGVEFTADGKYHALVVDGHGSLVRGTGFTAEGTWDVKFLEESFLEMWINPSQVMNSTPLCEDNPRRLAFPQSFSPDGGYSVYQAITP